MVAADPARSSVSGHAEAARMRAGPLNFNVRRGSPPPSNWATPAINATGHARATAAGMFTCWRNSLSGRKVPAAVLVGGRARVCCFVTVLACRSRGCRSSWRVSLGWFCCRAWLRLTRGCSGPGPQFGLRECGHDPMQAGPLNLHVSRGSPPRPRPGPLPPSTPLVTRGRRPQACSRAGVTR